MLQEGDNQLFFIVFLHNFAVCVAYSYGLCRSIFVLLCVPNSCPSNHVSACTHFNSLVLFFFLITSTKGCVGNVVFVLARAFCGYSVQVLLLGATVAGGSLQVHSLLDLCFSLFSSPRLL